MRGLLVQEVPGFTYGRRGVAAIDLGAGVVTLRAGLAPRTRVAALWHEWTHWRIHHRLGDTRWEEAAQWAYDVAWGAFLPAFLLAVWIRTRNRPTD